MCNVRVEVMTNLPETLEQLCARVDALEQRVHQLEQSSPAPAQVAAQPASASEIFSPAPEPPSGEQVSGAFLLLGKSLLGIAGAYLLRALAESGVLPRLLIAAIAIANDLVVVTNDTKDMERSGAKTLNPWI